MINKHSRNMDVTQTITKGDLDRIEASLQKILKANKKEQLGKEYLDLLEKLVDAFNELRLVVEFDHEKRLQAIEDFLANMD